MPSIIAHNFVRWLLLLLLIRQSIPFPPPIHSAPLLHHPTDVLFQVRLVKERRLCLIPRFGIQQTVPLPKMLQLLVAAFEERHNLGVGPRVQGDGPDKGRLHAERAVATAAGNAQEGPVRDRGPFERCSCSAAIAAMAVSRNGMQEAAAVEWELGFVVRRLMMMMMMMR